MPRGKGRGFGTGAGKRPKILRQPWILDAIQKSLELGMTFKDAALAAGLGQVTLFVYRRDGEQARRDLEDGVTTPRKLTPYQKQCIELVRRIDVAEAKCKQRNLALIQVAARDQWQAAAWLLERRFPREYSLTSTLRIEDDRPPVGDVQIAFIRGVDKHGQTPEDEGYRIDVGEQPRGSNGSNGSNGGNGTPLLLTQGGDNGDNGDTGS